MAMGYPILAAARAAAQQHASAPVPAHLRNAPTGFARSLGHGAGYQYPHDCENAVVAQAYLPAGLEALRLYEPKEVGAERETAKRAAWWRRPSGQCWGLVMRRCGVSARAAAASPTKRK